VTKTGCDEKRGEKPLQPSWGKKEVDKKKGTGNPTLSTGGDRGGHLPLNSKGPREKSKGTDAVDA